MCYLVPDKSMEHGYEHSSYCPLYSMVEEEVESMQNPEMMTDYVCVIQFLIYLWNMVMNTLVTAHSSLWQKKWQNLCKTPEMMTDYV